MQAESGDHDPDAEEEEEDDGTVDGMKVKLLPHQTTLLPPSRHLAIEGIEEEPEREKRQSPPYVPQILGVAEAVA